MSKGKELRSNFCQKISYHKGDLKEHTKRMHEKIKDFKRDSCEKTFVTSKEVRIHAKIN